MNELRWILLIAGALLIAGIYAWGLRSRSRRPGPDEAARRPAVFTGGAQGFEPAATAELADDEPEEGVLGPAREVRRIEPSVAIDEESLDTQRPAIERRAEFEPGVAEPPGVRREPTLGRRPEPPLAPRTEPAVGARLEPTFGPRAEPPPAAPPAKPAIEEPAPWTESSGQAAPTARSEPPVPPAQPSAPAATAASGAPASPAAKPKRPPQRIFAVRVSAPGTSRFEGRRILEALQAEGLQFGRYDIFHSLHADGRPVFSVASLRDPGTFDVQTMADTQYPGILVFTVLPGPVGAGEAFDDMLFTARALATHLEGALADEKGVPLTAHRAGRLREDALEFERSLTAA